MEPNASTSLRPLNRNEAAGLQKDFKPIRLVYSEQPLTARILVDGSKPLPIDDLIREFFSLHRMLLSKTCVDDIDICLTPHCDVREITVNQLTKLNGHEEPILLLTARSNSEYLLVRDLEELTFRQQTGLNVDISVLTRVQEENERLRAENEQQQKRIVDLESQLSNFETLREEMKQMCKEYQKEMKKIIEKNDEYCRRFDYLGQKLNDSTTTIRFKNRIVRCSIDIYQCLDKTNLSSVFSKNK